VIRGRLVGAGVLVLALYVGHVVTSELDINEVRTDPFVRTGTVGHAVHLVYADVEVTDVEPARYVAPVDDSELARMAGGVFVMVVATVTPTRASETMRAVYLVDEEGRQYVPSQKAACASTVTSSAAVPAYGLFCFDVPTGALAGLRFRIARGSEVYDSTRGDDMAEVDLGISPVDAKTWAKTEAAYRQDLYSDEPIELQPVTLTEVES